MATEDPVKAYNLRNSLLIGAWTTFAAAGILASSCGDQPKIGCLVAPAGGFATKLTEISREESSEGACDGFGPDSFNADPELGVNTYFERNSKGQVDYFKSSVAIQSIEVGTLAMTAEGFGVENSAEDGQLFSIGKFTVSRPNDENLCPAPKLSTTRLVLEEVPAVEDDPETEEDDSFPGQPAVDITLEWSNFLVYTAADSVGNQIEADLADTRRTPDGETCTIRYHAVGLNPAVSCQATDDMGTPLFDDDGNPETDPTLCESDANPSKNRFVGSGITPNTKWVCDPVIAYCVVNGEHIPQFK